MGLGKQARGITKDTKEGEATKGTKKRESALVTCLSRHFENLAQRLGFSEPGLIPARLEVAFRQARKAFFFEKKKQKTFDSAVADLSGRPPAGGESFLLFFKKGLPASMCHS